MAAATKAKWSHKTLTIEQKLELLGKLTGYIAKDRGGRLRHECNSKPIVHVSYFLLQHKHFSSIQSPNFLIEMMATNNTIETESSITEVDVHVAITQQEYTNTNREHNTNNEYENEYIGRKPMKMNIFTSFLPTFNSATQTHPSTCVTLAPLKCKSLHQ